MQYLYEIKAVDNSLINFDASGNTIVGYISSFGNIDKVGDIINKDAFNKTLKERPKVLHLVNHDFTRTTGFFDKIEVDDFGVRFEKNLNIEYEINGEKIRNTTATDLLILYKNGVIQEHSIGFKTIKYRIIENPDSPFVFYDNEKGEYVKGYREILELRLYEGSSLTIEAANPLTPFIGFKTAEQNERKNLIKNHFKKLYNILKKPNTNELNTQIEIALKQLEHMFNEPNEITRKQEPFNNTLVNNMDNELKILKEILLNLKN